MSKLERLIRKIIKEETSREEVELMDLNRDLKSLRKQGAPQELLDRYSKRFKTYKIGDLYVVDAGAPGIGSWTYKITKISGGKLYGVELSNNVRTLEPWETE